MLTHFQKRKKRNNNNKTVHMLIIQELLYCNLLLCKINSMFHIHTLTCYRAYTFPYSVLLSALT